MSQQVMLNSRVIFEMFLNMAVCIPNHINTCFFVTPSGIYPGFFWYLGYAEELFMLNSFHCRRLGHQYKVCVAAWSFGRHLWLHGILQQNRWRLWSRDVRKNMTGKGTLWLWAQFCKDLTWGTKPTLVIGPWSHFGTAAHSLCSLALKKSKKPSSSLLLATSNRPQKKSAAQPWIHSVKCHCLVDFFVPKWPFSPACSPCCLVLPSKIPLVCYLHILAYASSFITSCTSLPRNDATKEGRHIKFKGSSKNQFQ